MQRFTIYNSARSARSLPPATIYKSFQSRQSGNPEAGLTLHYFTYFRFKMQFITLLLTIAFAFHLELSDCAPLVQTGGTRLDATRNTTQPVRLLPNLPHAVM